MTRPMRTIALVGVILVAIGACADGDGGDPELVNPAAVYCEELGGTVSGDEPLCALPDGTVVDAWELYRSDHPAPAEDGSG